MLTISRVSKTYPNGVRALEGVNLSIGRGLFGLLGPNGAGPGAREWHGDGRLADERHRRGVGGA